MKPILLVILLVSSSFAKGPDSGTPDSSEEANRKGAERARARARAALRPPEELANHYNELGNDAARSEHKEQALKFYAKAAELGPGLWSPQANYGRALWFFNRYEESERHTAIALKLNPQAAQPHQIMSFLRRREGRFEEALDYARKGRALDAAYDYGFFPMQETYLLNCLANHEEAYRAAGKPQPNDPWRMIYERARASLESGHAAEALAEAKRLEPHQAEVAHAVQGEALVLLGRLDEAAAHAPLAGDDASYILGYVALRKGDKAAAESHFRKARAVFAANKAKLNGSRKCGKEYVSVMDAELAKLGAR